MALAIDPVVYARDQEFQEMSDEAAADLENMPREEVIRFQKEWMQKIEPDEKKKIKLKEGKKKKEEKKTSEQITAEFLLEQKPIREIADTRMMTQETIVSHIEKLREKGKCPDIAYLRREFRRSELDDIADAFEKAGTLTLSPVFSILAKEKKNPTFFKIRLARLFL
jgi:hypothetical protein